MDAIGQNHPQLHFIYLAEANIRYAMLSFYTAVTQSGRAQTEVTPVNQSSVQSHAVAVLWLAYTTQNGEEKSLQEKTINQ